MGHARALLGMTDSAAQRHAAREVISRALSVRETETLVKEIATPKAQRAPKEAGPDATPPENDVHTRAAEDRLRFVLGTKVRIARKGQGGTIEIDFTSEDELNRLYEVLTATR
jgi:ParB family chromosome partitioning protein